jgi:hypothetical protein
MLFSEQTGTQSRLIFRFFFGGGEERMAATAHYNFQLPFLVAFFFFRMHSVLFFFRNAIAINSHTVERPLTDCLLLTPPLLDLWVAACPPSLPPPSLLRRPLSHQREGRSWRKEGEVNKPESARLSCMQERSRGGVQERTNKVTEFDFKRVRST